MKSSLNLMRLLKTAILSLLLLNSAQLFSEEDDKNAHLRDVEYVTVHPVITTNYAKKNSNKIGFVQLSARLIVENKTDEKPLYEHMPIIRDYIIEFLNFTDQTLIKDTAKRDQLRASMTKGLRELLTEQIGEPLVIDIVFTQFIWN